MPLYEYECKQCHQRLEKIQSFSAPPEKICPKCGGELERVISAPAIQFKGAGWYVNDYAKSGASKAPVNASESKSETKSESASESKADGAKSSVESVSASAADGASTKSAPTSSSNTSTTPSTSSNS